MRANRVRLTSKGNTQRVGVSAARHETFWARRSSGGRRRGLTDWTFCGEMRGAGKFSRMFMYAGVSVALWSILEKIHGDGRQGELEGDVGLPADVGVGPAPPRCSGPAAACPPYPGPW